MIAVERTHERMVLEYTSPIYENICVTDRQTKYSRAEGIVVIPLPSPSLSDGVIRSLSNSGGSQREEIEWNNTIPISK